MFIYEAILTAVYIVVYVTNDLSYKTAVDVTVSSTSGQALKVNGVVGLSYTKKVGGSL